MSASNDNPLHEPNQSARPARLPGWFTSGPAPIFHELYGAVRAAMMDSGLDTPRSASTTARHSIDFRSVLWFGTAYSFTASQAACIRILWQAWENGTPDIGQETVTEAAGLDTPRLAPLFRGHKAWGSMIVPGGTKGTYRLKS